MNDMGEWSAMSLLAMNFVREGQRIGREHDTIRELLAEGPRDVFLAGETFGLSLKEMK